MKNMRSLRALMLTMVGFLLAGTAAKADSFSFTIDSSFQYAVAGETLAFDATVTNLDPTTTVWLNSAQNTSLDVPLTADTNPFYNNFPFYLTPAGVAGDTFDGEMFDVTVPLGTAPGIYVGWMEVLGGSDGNASNLLGSESFTVDVTPEPASLLLLASGVAGIAGLLRRRLIV
ncbi:MAG: PEP-CTERM sorting domain-containing protein [Terracidiphilus sp.]